MSAYANTVRIIADTDDDVDVKGALPVPDEIVGRIHNVSTTVLQKNLAGLMGQIEDMFGTAQKALSNFAVKEVKIGVGVNGSGEFSLLGITKASAELKATFEITFVPKQEKQ